MWPKSRWGSWSKRGGVGRGEEVAEEGALGLEVPEGNT